MGRPRRAEPVKLFVGLLGGDEDLLRRARQLLTRAWGPIEHETPIRDFTYSDYYRAEMGEGLRRVFLVFERPIAADEIAEIKLATNALEKEIADQAMADVERPVNIDPGYVDLAKLVLATTKDRSHRIYLGQGIYAEVTLHYSDERWQASPWTYPEFHEPDIQAFLSDVRRSLHEQRRAWRRALEEGAAKE
jgi:hypothetical protein